MKRLQLKKSYHLLFTPLLIASLTGCGPEFEKLFSLIPKPGASSQSNTSAKGELNFATPTMELRLNEEKNLRTFLTGEIPSGLNWNSNNSGIVSVNSEGQVKAHSPGSAYITLTAPNLSKELRLEIKVVESGATANVKITPSNLVLAVNETNKLQAAVTTADGQINSVVTWSSSDDSIATVNATSGNVAALKEGVVTIVATSTVDSRQKGTTTITVVKDKTNVPSTPDVITFGPNRPNPISTNTPVARPSVPPGEFQEDPTTPNTPAASVKLTGAIYGYTGHEVFKLDLATKTKFTLVNENSYLGAPPVSITSMIFDEQDTLYFTGQVNHRFAIHDVYALKLSSKNLAKLDIPVPPVANCPTCTTVRIDTMGFFNSQLHYIGTNVSSNKTHLVKQDASEPEVVPGGGQFSSKGQLAFTEGTRIMVGNSNRSVETELIDLKALNVNFNSMVWNPAGDALAVWTTATGAGNYLLYTLDLAGNIKKIKTFKSPDLTFLHWSPNSAYIAYVASGKLVVLDATTGAETETGLTIPSSQGLLWLNQ